MSNLTPQQTKAFVENQNRYRQNVSPPAQKMPALIWDDDLAESASQWAQQCQWGHSGTPNVGENIYGTTSMAPMHSFRPVEAIDSWGNEKQYYDYKTNSCQPGQVCGHYTQMVWADTDKVGCAAQTCPTFKNFPWKSGTFVVCQYSPPGNYIGQRPYRAAS